MSQVHGERRWRWTTTGVRSVGLAIAFVGGLFQALTPIDQPCADCGQTNFGWEIAAAGGAVTVGSAVYEIAAASGATERANAVTIAPIAGAHATGISIAGRF